MPVSNHRKLELFKLSNSEPVAVRQMDGSVFLIYPSESVHIAKRDWHVIRYGQPDEAAYLDSIGACARRAQKAVRDGEGIVDPRSRLLEGSRRFQATLLEFQSRIQKPS